MKPVSEMNRRELEERIATLELLSEATSRLADETKVTTAQMTRSLELIRDLLAEWPSRDPHSREAAAFREAVRALNPEP